MGRKNEDDGIKQGQVSKRRMGKNRSLSEYAASRMPKGAVIDFIFYEDFNNDSLKEAVIGVTRFTPFPPDSAILIVKNGKNGDIEHQWLPLQDGTQGYDQAAVIDNAAAADIDADGSPELIVSRVLSHEHDIDFTVIDWKGDNAYHAWHSGKTFFHGSMEVNDADGDGVAEIIAECGTKAGHEIISLEETCYHVRESFMYKWDGKAFAVKPHSVKMPYESYNAAVNFLRYIWLREYEKAYSMVVIPPFLGLVGLDDNSLPAFRNYVDRKILPVMARNLLRGKLVPSEPYDTCCHFSGPEDDFTVELIKDSEGVKICRLVISKKYKR
mgnify:CR=1 FL=1